MLGSIREIIIYAADMDAQVRFYRDTLKLQIAYPTGLDDYSKEHWVEFNTGACILALHSGGSMQFGKDAPKFVFTVDDVSKVRETLLDLGVEMGEIRSPAANVQVVDGKDPEGNIFSIENR